MSSTGGAPSRVRFLPPRTASARGTLTIACCLWGEFPEPGWSDEYVRRLRNSVGRNLSAGFRFVCFADRALAIDGVEVRPLRPPHWQGHLPKTYVYSPEAGLEGRVLLFDLDNVITGSLEGMAAYGGPLCVRGRLQYGRPQRQPDGDMISFVGGSETALELWEKAQHPSLPATTQGREREFILQAAPHCHQWQDVVPGHVVSYRHDCIARNNGKLPPNARVVSMHGRPRPHQVDDEFIVTNWR